MVNQEQETEVFLTGNKKNGHDIFSDQVSDPKREVNPEKVRILLQKVRVFSIGKKILLGYGRFQKVFFIVEPILRFLAYVYLAITLFR